MSRLTLWMLNERFNKLKFSAKVLHILQVVSFYKTMCTKGIPYHHSLFLIVVFGNFFITIVFWHFCYKNELHMHRDTRRKWVTVSQDVGQMVPMPLESVFKKAFRKWSVPKTSQGTIMNKYLYTFYFTTISFTTSESELGYYHEKVNVRVAERSTSTVMQIT